MPTRPKSPAVKLVVRALPPSLSEAEFQDTIAPFLQNISWSAFVAGKTKTVNSVNSRAYLAMKSDELAREFVQKFNGHVFINAKGDPFRAQVEFAPYQKIPRSRRHRDHREGTIETDADYKAFLEQIDKPIEMLPSAEIQLERRENEKDSAPPSVPALIQEILDKRAKAQQRRQLASANTQYRLAGGENKGAAANGRKGKRVEKSKKSGPLNAQGAMLAGDMNAPTTQQLSGGGGGGGAKRGGRSRRNKHPEAAPVGSELEPIPEKPSRRRSGQKSRKGNSQQQGNDPRVPGGNKEARPSSAPAVTSSNVVKPNSAKWKPEGEIKLWSLKKPETPAPST